MKGEIAETGIANFVQKAFDIISVTFSPNIEHLIFKNHTMVSQWKRIHNQRYRAVRRDHPSQIF